MAGSVPKQFRLGGRNDDYAKISNARGRLPLGAALAMSLLTFRTVYRLNCGSM